MMLALSIAAGDASVVGKVVTGDGHARSSSFEFEVNTAVQEAPDLPLWARPQKVDVFRPAAGDSITVARFSPVPGARSVRVGRPGGTVSLTEISAWPGRPPGSPRASPSAEQPIEGVAVPLDTTDRPVSLLVTAAVVLGAVAAAVAVIAVTRSRRRAPVT